MSVCDMCAHCGVHQDRKCTFSGKCIVNTYNLHGTGSLDAFMNPKVEETPEVVVADVVETVSNFNPFQRGNGCMLADSVKVR